MKNLSLSHHLVTILLALLLSLSVASHSVQQVAGKGQTQQHAAPEHPLLQAAQADWDNQRWEQAIIKYRQFVAQFPNHPLAAEAHFQIGYYLSYVATPAEAIAEYDKAIAQAPKSHIAQEAKEGIAALKYYLQDYQAALDLFREVMQETDDWAAFKDAAYRLKEMSHLLALQKLPNQRTSMDCGARALEIACANRRLKAPGQKVDQELKKLFAASGGVTLEQLRVAAQSAGIKAWGVRLKAEQLQTIPKPFIAHIRTNHYLVVTGVSRERVSFTDPHRGPNYRTVERFNRIWRGEALVFASTLPAGLRAQLLSPSEMEQIRGGHHLHGDNRGDCGENPASRCERDPCNQSPGLPGWSVNLSNYNLIVQDTDFTYSGLGPRIALTRTYNADLPEEGIFGRSWTSNYEVSLAIEVNGNVNVKREAGKKDNFSLRGDGTFIPPLWNHDQLFKNADGTYRLEIKRTKLTQHFNAQGRLTRIADRNGNAVTLQYDTNNRLQSVTDAAGRVTRFNYHASGKVSEVIDPIGRRVTFTYDSRNNLTSTVDMAGNLVSYAYDDRSYMTSYTTPKGTTQFRNGTSPHFSEIPFLLKDVTDPAGNTTRFDTGNEIAWVIDARGNQTFYFNNSNGETTEIEDPLGNKTGFTFTAGNLTRITDANGHNTTLSYDVRGNATRITDALGNKVEFQYDSRDNLTLLVDQLSNTHRYVYDAKDNLVRSTDPKNGSTTYVYDTLGQLITLTDARQSTAEFRYDEKGNLISMRNPIGGVTSYTHDGIGRLASLTDPKNNTFRYSYDGIDRLTEILHPDGATTQHSYDCCSLSSVTDPSGTLRFENDQAGRLRRFINAQNQTIQYSYDPKGNLTALTYPDGKVVRYEYDTASHLRKVTDWLNNTTDYNYDPVGNLISSINSNGTLTGYQYDAANRLVNLINARFDGSVISSYKYKLDGLGNRTDVAAIEPISPVLAPRSVSTEYDADNRIRNSNGVAFTYDDNGNLLFSPTAYRYDAFDRLIQVNVPGYSAQYQYDGLGNRIARTVNGSVTKYIVDASGLLSRVLTEADSSGIVLSYYIYGLGLISKVTPTGRAYFYHYDGIGSTNAVTDTMGNIVNKYAYSQFGGLFSNSTETIPNPFRFVGALGVMDEGNDLLYMRARYYVPSIGRFTNKDPLGLTGGLNMYVYAKNNPLMLIDPSGEFSLAFLIRVVGFVIAIRVVSDCLEEIEKAKSKIRTINQCDIDPLDPNTSAFPYTAAIEEALRKCTLAAAEFYVRVFKRIPKLGR